MTFSVQWTTSEGVVSMVRETALGAYLEAERVTKLGVQNVRIGLPNGNLVELADFRYLFEQP
ncbi:hypothetical protein [Methylorubrum extorquens]|jgi:hypothetical protein|uniref:Uncharacterized protein n=1 Tax=Methylorubrum extorquens (strain ATCC 14718 / DSM 1338 / JCM 2805 / NCIMB 9133 / AM1) TaxID=272630 RepID=C5B1C1_METEA|nr:hypothetical protein [Methylorubrum extorquens]ACS41722.1 hypothetical protein MexAM1_META1p4063 [Methylorubrum extorquens AM1]MCP1545251.1 hypothetical protein [Methylorubrum extorquens]MCP1587402.1 hypothetical protein [Methylorubrum extorquens]